MRTDERERDREKTAVLWTKEQAEAIRKRGKNILVSAAAGSGKTAVLVERIKKLISEENISLDEMLIVTFTNAAASEMREKIVSAIPEQMDQIHKSHISTFHSFALDVIRRYFHLIEIEPGFRICDETQKILLQNAAMDELFRLKFEEGAEDFLVFLRLYGSGKNEDAVKKMILDTHSFIQSLPDPMDWLYQKTNLLRQDTESFRSQQPFGEIREDILELLETALFSAMKVKKVLESYSLKSLAQKAEEDLVMLREIQAAFVADFETGAELVRSSKFKTFTAAKEEKENYEAVREDIGLLRQEAKDALKNISTRYCMKFLSAYVEEMNETANAAATLYQLVDSFDWIYSRNKEKQGVIDFSDIEHYALRILAHEEAAEEYRTKCRYIFSDEYQDSKMVQECLIKCICRENNLFMVGDVKQSIYKFRLAEPEIFIQKYETYRKGEDPESVKIDLNRNFRSKEQIIKTVNAVFEKVMTKRRAGMLYDEESELKKGVTYDGALNYPVELCLVDERGDEEEVDDEIKDMKRAELEAAAAALIVKKAKGLPFYDEKEKKEKLLQNKDIVILLRSTANVADIYREALQREGIPAYIDIGDGFFDTLEVSVFLNFLKIIDNRRQDIPFLSALRSPIFGFSVTELSLVRSQKKKGSYFDAFLSSAKEGESQELREKANSVLGKLNYYRKRSKFLPLSEFVWEVLRDSEYYLYAGALPGGNQRQANLRALADKASLYEANFSKGLFGFINYIEAIKKGRIAAAPVKLIGESDDVVRIMTVHKSKGLEFPMVLVGGLGRRFRAQSSDRVTMHKDLGLALKQIDRERNCQRRTLLQEIIDRRKNRDDLAEEIRILYVALTRAKDKLILLGTVSDVEKTLHIAGLKRDRGLFGESCYFDFLLPTIGFSAEVRRSIVGRKSLSHDKESNRMKREQLRDAFFGDAECCVPSIASKVESRLSWEYPFPCAADIKSKYSVSELAKEAQPTFGLSPSMVRGSAQKGELASPSASEAARRGTIYHKVMEQLPFVPGGMDEEEIRAFVEEMVARELLTREEAAEIAAKKIAAFFASDIGKRACSAESIYKEISFNLKKKREGETIIVQGTIDCYFIENGNYILLDYKTNFVGDKKEEIEGLGEFYRPQLSLYKEALEEIRGVKVSEMHLYLFAADKGIQL